ncbi:hypothetical protein CEXT_546131 [Caerostris extrusa]|uniref:Uncharacterized protein n=1 Tax=Caerostris extrusa TaxID=172846 RepID=A0AAV4S199_CAEEX|nr:hypothetical protein CEXT_546131 [Caerostris extrusa]
MHAYASNVAHQFQYDFLRRDIFARGGITPTLALMEVVIPDFMTVSEGDRGDKTQLANYRLRSNTPSSRMSRSKLLR